MSHCPTPLGLGRWDSPLEDAFHARLRELNLLRDLADAEALVPQFEYLIAMLIALAGTLALSEHVLKRLAAGSAVA